MDNKAWAQEVAKKIKEKEKEENKLDLEKEENEVASTIDMIIE